MSRQAKVLRHFASSLFGAESTLQRGLCAEQRRSENESLKRSDDPRFKELSGLSYKKFLIISRSDKELAKKQT